MTVETESDEPMVRGLLAAAGLRPSDEEVATLTAAYPALRATADRLHDLDIGYADSALTLVHRPGGPGDRGAEAVS